MFAEFYRVLTHEVMRELLGLLTADLNFTNHTIMKANGSINSQENVTSQTCRVGLGCNNPSCHNAAKVATQTVQD
jgi:hypothetical protein